MTQLYIFVPQTLVCFTNHCWQDRPLYPSGHEHSSTGVVPKDAAPPERSSISVEMETLAMLQKQRGANG